VAVGVLLDTMLVRSLLVPAAVVLIGPRTWWPSRLAKEQPSHSVEEDIDLATS
jgi:RND superfamily putative drug exporter